MPKPVNSRLHNTELSTKSNITMASKAGSRMRNIINRIPTGAYTHPNTNEKIKLSIAIKVETKNAHWIRPTEVAKGQADALWNVIDHNKDRLKPGTVEISQR
jgi:hypothetical protein